MPSWQPGQILSALGAGNDELAAINAKLDQIIQLLRVIETELQSLESQLDYADYDAVYASTVPFVNQCRQRAAQHHGESVATATPRPGANSGASHLPRRREAAEAAHSRPQQPCSTRRHSYRQGFCSLLHHKRSR